MQGSQNVEVSALDGERHAQAHDSSQHTHLTFVLSLLLELVSSQQARMLGVHSFANHLQEHKDAHVVEGLATRVCFTIRRDENVTASPTNRSHFCGKRFLKIEGKVPRRRWLMCKPCTQQWTAGVLLRRTPSHSRCIAVAYTILWALSVSKVRV